MKTFRMGQPAEFSSDAYNRVESVLSALEQLEIFLPHAREQAFLRKRRALNSTTDQMEKEFIESELDVMELEWRDQFPAYFYGSLLVLLWSEVETIIGRFADEAKAVKGALLDFGDIKGSSTYSRLRKYVEAILGVLLREDSDLEDLAFLRNLYAHHSGHVHSQTEKQMERIRSIAKKHGLTLTDEYLIPRATYIKDAAYKAQLLIKRLRDVHPSTEPPLVEIEKQA